MLQNLLHVEVCIWPWKVCNAIPKQGWGSNVVSNFSANSSDFESGGFPIGYCAVHSACCGQALSSATCSMDPVFQRSSQISRLDSWSWWMVMYQLLPCLKISENLICFQAGEKLLSCDITIIASLHFVFRLQECATQFRRIKVFPYVFCAKICRAGTFFLSIFTNCAFHNWAAFSSSFQ